MGSPDFACPSLQKLIASKHDIVAVYAQPPRPAGRGQKLKQTAVHALAAEHGISVYTPLKLRDDALTELLNIECDAIVVVAYGLLLPQAVLDKAPCLNVHPSALPRWRGAAPLQHALLHGDATTDICIMQLDIGMDTGPVYARKSMNIPTQMTLGELHDITAEHGADMLLEVLSDLGKRTPEAQEERGATLAHKITPDMRPIDWGQPANIVHNHIRALNPFPTATLTFGDETWKILGSELNTEGHNKPVGTVITTSVDGIDVACGKQTVLRLTKLQRPGKKPLLMQEFLAGFKFSENACFG